ncbi:MAG TPA: hypothetical protein VFV37_11100 [Luteibaculaceae bacterium]|nr:hypothetical protein [Luteibaculaceae bacterium]
MVVQRHFIRGTEVNPPRNAPELSIQLNFRPDDTESVVSLTSFEWIEKEMDTLLSIFSEGLTGGAGITEGVEHLIRVEDEGAALDFKAYIDLTTAKVDYTADVPNITADSKPEAGLDWISEVADGISFDYLASIGKITQADYVYVPYVLNTVPNYREAFITLLSITFVIVELTKVISDLNASVAESSTIIDTAGGVIRLIFTIIYAVFLFITIVDLVLALLDLVIQRVKYVPGMYVNDLARIGFNHFGLNYESDIIPTKAFIIPSVFSPPNNPEDSRIKGLFTRDTSDQTGYYKGSFGQFLRDINTTFETKVELDGFTARIVPRNNRPTTATFKFPPVDQDAFTTNASEFVTAINLSFLPDASDPNTIENWFGTNVDIIYEPITATDPRRQLVRNFRQIQIPFARAIAKQELNTYEKIADVLLTIVDGIISVIVAIANGVIGIINTALGFIRLIEKLLRFIGVELPFTIPSIPSIPYPDFRNRIDDRVGMLLLEKDFFSINKICLIDRGNSDRTNKLALDNLSEFRALNMWNKYHSKSNEQLYIRDYSDIEMSLQDVITVKNEGAVVIPTGSVATVRSAQYNVEGRIATFTVEEPRLWTNNFNIVINEPSGR